MFRQLWPRALGAQKSRGTEPDRNEKKAELKAHGGQSRSSARDSAALAAGFIIFIIIIIRRFDMQVAEMRARARWSVCARERGRRKRR